ncbi:alpha/beta fold hydrolase [Pseudooceanicola sp.]|uniref:alpha/beta fold hydrolase n=1 Tax=Pseudooceanicola sp. TaxID=1914328 RepID=UPI002604C300|nr:alpha/beta fold hydrolase [Pseudooceanicola sp.]MDF1854137.1 alpha/beta fold hydrolase [Pseudooceanicola sp.]
MIAALGLLLALLAAATLWRVSTRRNAALAAHPPAGAFVTVAGHRVHYLQRGSGPDLILIHGASGNTTDMDLAIAPELSKRYRVTLFDRPGLGHSPALAARGVTLADQADLLSAAARALGLQPAVIAGQSLGGAVVMTWALRHPEDVVALVSIAGATHPWPGELSRLHLNLARPILGPVLAHLIAAWVPTTYLRAQVDAVFTPQPAPPGYADQIGTGLVARPESLIANAQQRSDLRAELQGQAPEYARLLLPIEIVHGSADDIVSLDIHAKVLASQAPNAHLAVLPGIGHMPHHVATPEVIAAIDRAAARAGLH